MPPPTGALFAAMVTFLIVADPSEMNPLEGEMTEKFESMKALYAEYATTHNIMEVDAAWNPFKAASD